MANKLCWALLATLPAVVFAQNPAQPNYLDEMAKIDAQIAYLQKQNELREILKKSSNNEGLPRILSILVDEKGALAQVVYGSGIVRWLKKGDVLAEGLRVLAVTKSSVLVGGTDSKFSLSFAAPQTTGSTGAPSASGPLPPLPQINIPMPLPPSVSPPPAARPAAPATVSSGASPAPGGTPPAASGAK